MSHFVSVEVEPESQVTRTQHTVEISYGCEFLGCQPSVKRVQSLDTLIFAVDVSFHKVDVGCKVIKECACEPPAQHRDPEVRISLGERIHHGDGHSHVSQG